MEDFITSALQSGNTTAILSAVIVYLVIYFQRKNTGAERDNMTDKLFEEIADLRKDNELKQKDINYLLNENNIVKEDIKEIKATLNQMAISLAKIAAKYDSKE